MLYNTHMKEQTSNALQKIAKYLIFAGVIASFFFIGWRIATKGEYERRELAQCEALAVSAAFAVCDALDSSALAAHVRENGATEFIIDHMKMPGHNVVAVTITPEAEGFTVLSRAETNWNSRSPQKYEFTAVKGDGGVDYPKENAAAKAFLALNDLHLSARAALPRPLRRNRNKSKRPAQNPADNPAAGEVAALE